MKKEVVIIGGGIIGLCSAYYLQKEGHQVTIVDQSDLSTGASYVNAGMITPSHFIPLASPGIITKGIKWMFDSESPFYIKPRFDLDLLKWGWMFKKSATKKHVEKAIPAIININILGRELYHEIQVSEEFDFHLVKNGMLMYFQTDKAGEEEWEVGKIGIEHGLNVSLLSKEDLKKLEPHIDLNVKGAVYFDSDAHMTPKEFMTKMKAHLLSRGVEIKTNQTVVDFKISGDKIVALKTSKGEISGDEIVIASGSWSSKLAKILNTAIPLQAGKGYCIDVLSETGIKIPSILVEAKVAVTPMNGFTRFSGTMEIDKINHDINPRRVKVIARAAENYYKNIKIDSSEIDNASCGLRPCSPDGLPYIGRINKYKNVTLATGHAMMGWSTGPATGKLVSEIISEKNLSLNLDPFNPNRKF